MYALLVVFVVEGMVFIVVVEACRWVVIVLVIGGVGRGRRGGCGSGSGSEGRWWWRCYGVVSCV